jgi:hypothetical protein
MARVTGSGALLPSGIDLKARKAQLSTFDLPVAEEPVTRLRSPKPRTRRSIRALAICISEKRKRDRGKPSLSLRASYGRTS